VRRLWKVLAYGGLLVTVTVLLMYAFITPAAQVELARVTRGPLEVTVNEDGKTRIKERYIVVAPLGGELLRIERHVGDVVKAGETVLAVIEPPDPSLLDSRSQAEAEARVKAAEARLEHAKALLSRAQASHAYAVVEHARVEKLLPTKTATREAYDEAVHLLRTAAEDVRAGEFTVRIAEFELEMAEAALSRTKPDALSADTRLEVRSPIDGQVLRVFRESEGLLAPGTQLMELGDTNNLEVEVDVLSSDAVRIPGGGKMYLEHWGAAQPLLAHVRLVEPQAFLKVSALGVEEQRVNVIADFVDAAEARGRLGDAYRVEARIVIWHGDNVLKTNAGAIFRYAGGWAVYRAVSGRARLTEVKIGHSNGLETEILDGVREGDNLIAYPSDQIRDGVRITPRQDQH